MTDAPLRLLLQSAYLVLYGKVCLVLQQRLEKRLMFIDNSNHQRCFSISVLCSAPGRNNQVGLFVMSKFGLEQFWMGRIKVRVEQWRSQDLISGGGGHNNFYYVM
jgi:hypothetical protein